MLILGRRVGETVMIGDTIQVTVVSVRRNQVRIGIAAPMEISVHREEIYKRIASTRRGRIREGQPPTHMGSMLSAHAPPASERQEAAKAVNAAMALEECIGAICLVEVTLHSLESQEIASPEQEVLKRALKANWVVHDWIDELNSRDPDSDGIDPEDEP